MDTFQRKTKGQGGGIGTLIIFIAIVLVAAIAAYVLLGTAGTLQSRSLLVGKESTTRVSTQLQVENVFGIANDTTLNQAHGIEEVIATVKLSPGSTPVDMEKLLLQYATGDVLISRISHNQTVQAWGGADNGTYKYNDKPDFVFKELLGNGDGLIETEESFQIYFFIQDHPPGYSSPQNFTLQPAERFAWHFRPPEGAEVVIEGQAPSQITKRVIRLYP